MERLDAVAAELETDSPDVKDQLHDTHNRYETLQKQLEGLVTDLEAEQAEQSAYRDMLQVHTTIQFSRLLLFLAGEKFPHPDRKEKMFLSLTSSGETKIVCCGLQTEKHFAISGQTISCFAELREVDPADVVQVDGVQLDEHRLHGSDTGTTGQIQGNLEVSFLCVQTIGD